MFVVLPLLFVWLPADVLGFYLSDLTDLTLPSEPQDEPSVTLSKDCWSKRKYLYQAQCWDLLSRGPCVEGQWLVLVRPNYEETPEVKCAKRKCSDPDLYWPLDGFCYDAETARRRRLCPQPGTELVSNEFGDGHCGCRRSDKVPYVKVVSAEADTEDENSQPCYPLYSQGPCPQGQVLESIAWGYGNCTVDKCISKNRRYEPPLPLRLNFKLPQKQFQQKQQYQQQEQEQKPQYQQLHQHQQLQQHQKTQLIKIPWNDGLCYELDTQGPCGDNKQFTILQDTMRPGCIKSAIELHLTKGGCFKTHTGACQDQIEFHTSSSTESLEQEIINQFNNKNKKHHNS